MNFSRIEGNSKIYKFSELHFLIESLIFKLYFRNQGTSESVRTFLEVTFGKCLQNFGKLWIKSTTMMAQIQQKRRFSLFFPFFLFFNQKVMLSSNKTSNFTSINAFSLLWTNDVQSKWPAAFQFQLTELSKKKKNEANFDIKT